jgi:hypothetical protein
MHGATWSHVRSTAALPREGGGAWRQSDGGLPTAERPLGASAAVVAAHSHRRPTTHQRHQCAAH